MSKLATMKFKGSSGKSYSFVVYPFDTSFKQVAAIYVVSRRYKSNNGSHSHDTLYIGQTDNLPERFGGHHKAYCFENHNANAICIHQAGSKQARLNIESDLLENHNPVCNG